MEEGRCFVSRDVEGLLCFSKATAQAGALSVPISSENLLAIIPVLSSVLSLKVSLHLARVS
jgi:hypothetical protein